jgi:hypothetical protein
MLATIRMKRTITYIFLTLILAQVIGYYTVGKKLLIDQVINERLAFERPTALDLSEIQSIKINSDYDLTSKHKSKLQNLFKAKTIRYNYYNDITDIPSDSLFLENDFNYTIDILKYRFPTSNLFVGESIQGFVAHDESLYAWILIKWVRIKVVSGGMS